MLEGADPVLLATMHEYGDLPIYLSVGGAQIVVSVLLWPVSEQSDTARFNEFLLKAQRVVPLSNFAITTVGDQDVYELMGELSSKTTLQTILIELRTLAENAIDATPCAIPSPPESGEPRPCPCCPNSPPCSAAPPMTPAQGVVDSNALKILDQEIRDADTAPGQGPRRPRRSGGPSPHGRERDDIVPGSDRQIRNPRPAPLSVRARPISPAKSPAASPSWNPRSARASPLIDNMKQAEARLRTAIASTDQKIETLRREIDIVKVNESVQRAQTSVALQSAGAHSRIGSAADSLQRIKQRQAVQEERLRVGQEFEDKRTGADLDAKLKEAGILPGHSSADDVLARLTQQDVTVVTPRIGQATPAADKEPG